MPRFPNTSSFAPPISLSRLGRAAFVGGAFVLALVGCSSDSASTDVVVDAAPTAIEIAEIPTAEPTAVPGATEVPAAEPTAIPAPPVGASTEPEPTREPAANSEPTPEPTALPEPTSEQSATEAPAALDGVLTDVVADAQGGRSAFDGNVDQIGDLEDLVADAWGDGGLGLHRGHAQVENVLEAFLGIDHDQMHEYMDAGLNLAATSEALDTNPDALVETLVNSYRPFVAQGVTNGVITEAEAAEWVELIRTEFDDRVYWDGVSSS